jgi:hypothetical protein
MIAHIFRLQDGLVRGKVFTSTCSERISKVLLYLLINSSDDQARANVNAATFPPTPHTLTLFIIQSVPEIVGFIAVVSCSKLLIKLLLCIKQSILSACV